MIFIIPISTLKAYARYIACSSWFSKIETIYFFLTTWGVGGMASATASLRGNAATDNELAELAIDVVIDGLRMPS